MTQARPSPGYTASTPHPVVYVDAAVHERDGRCMVPTGLAEKSCGGSAGDTPQEVVKAAMWSLGGTVRAQTRLVSPDDPTRGPDRILVEQALAGLKPTTASCWRCVCHDLKFDQVARLECPRPR